MARLEHPNILRVFDHGETDGLLYAVTQLVEGRSLDQILRDRRRLEPDAAVEIAVRIGTALTFAHWQGVIHGDIKPSNVMVSTDGDVLLADFGSHTRSADAMLASTLTVFGTPAYMSPEQAMGEPLDARSDVFSLGAMFYELLTGRKWFAPGGESLSSSEIVKRVVEAEPRPVQDLVPDLRDAVSVVVHQALTKDRTRRQQTAADFVNGLLPAKAVALGLLTVDADSSTSSPRSSFGWLRARQLFCR